MFAYVVFFVNLFCRHFGAESSFRIKIVSMRLGKPCALHRVCQKFPNVALEKNAYVGLIDDDPFLSIQRGS